MLHEQKCTDCGVVMSEDGFIVDFAHGATIVSRWYPGRPQFSKFFGLATGSVKIKQKELIDVTTLRCPNCGLLKSYAIKADDTGPFR